MTYKDHALPHIGKLCVPALPDGWSAGEWTWPYPKDGCCRPGVLYSEPSHQDHELKHHDAFNVEITRADGKRDFVRISGEYVRSHTAQEIKDLLDVQTYGEK